MAPRFIARQLARPQGFPGRVIGRLMNWHNADMNAFAVRLLELTEADRVLEIGFGGGLNLPALLQSAAFVAGVDRSADVIDWAKIRYARAITTGRADFRVGRVEELPFEAASFDKVCTVNTVYFWESLGVGFAEIHRVLAPGGCAFVGFLPKVHMQRKRMPPDIFTLRTADDVREALGKTGFRNVRTERPQPDTPWNVMIATR
jgi:arsenite methyltransferase